MSMRSAAWIGVLGMVLTTPGSARAGDGGPLRVSGSLAHESRPVAHATVRLVDDALEAPNRVISKTRSDGEGDFVIDVPWRASFEDRMNWILLIDVPDLAPVVVELENELLGLRPGGEWALGGVFLDRGCAVEGRVVVPGDEAVEPLSGAHVVVWHEFFDRPWEAVTDEEGVFAATGLMAGRYAIGVEHPDWLSTRRDLKVTCLPGESLGTIELDQGDRLELEVTLEDGRPGEGATVYSLPLPPSGATPKWLAAASGTVDPGGRIMVEVGISTSPWLLFVRKRGWISSGTRWRKPHGMPAGPFMVTLKSPTRVRGRVFDVSDNEIEGAEVGVFKRDAVGEESAVVEAVSDRYGRFDSGPLAPGRYQLRAWAADHEPASEEIVIEASSMRPAVVRLELAPSATATGLFEVVDAAGEPVEGAEVEVFGLEFHSWRLPCYTGVDGRCSIPGVPTEEQLHVGASHPGFDRRSEYVAELDPETYWTIAFDEPAWRLLAVEGRVVDDTGEPVLGAEVSLTVPLEHASTWRQTRTDSEGRFVLPEVPEGAYALDIRSAGWAPSLSPLKVVAGMGAIAVDLRRGARVRGRPLGASPADFDRLAAVHVGWPQEEPVEPCVITVGGSQGFPTPGNGRIEGTKYVVEDLPVGVWHLSTNGHPSWSADVSVTEASRELIVDLHRPEPEDCGGDRSLPLAAERSRVDTPLSQGDQSFTYAIQYRSGVAPSCIALQLIHASGAIPVDEQCADPSGTWRDLQRGDYRLELLEFGGQEWPVTIPSPARTFVISPTGKLHLRVLDHELDYRSGRDWPSGLEVELTPIGGDEREPISVMDQVYFPAIAAGWWEVRIHLASGESWTKIIEIEEHQQRTLMLP